MPGSAMREERKVVTALFADTVGSAEIAERLDPEDAHELIRGAIALAIEAAEAYGGTVKDLAGDGALILFGAPVSHEDDAERAVRAGLEIVRSIDGYAEELRARGLEGFSMRVGIETGLVVLGPVGGGGRVEYGATGDAVNTAARVQGQAEPGTVLVGPGTYDRVASLFEWGAELDVDLKGKSDTVVVREARAARRQGGSARRLEGMTASLVGRHGEMARFLAALPGAGSDGAEVLLITGEAGVGKSRLVREARAAAPDGIVWLEARAASFADRTPYSVFRDLLIDALDASSGEEALERIRRLGGETSIPFAATLMGVSDADPDGRVGALSPASLQRGLIAVIGRELEARREEHPLVVVIEDLHWADPSSLELLTPVIEAMAHDAVLFVLTARRETEHASSGFIEQALTLGAHLMHLEALPSGADRALLIELVGSGVLPLAVEARLLEAAEGNPFFLEELVRSLRDAGALRLAEGTWQLDASVALHVPPTVEQVVLARLDRLSEGNRDIVDAACVLGRGFDLELLAEVADGSPEGVESSISALRQLDIVRRSSIGGGGDDPDPEDRAAEYQFAHVLIQETAYRALVRRRRTPLHLRAARALEPRVGITPGTAGLVGRHYRIAGDPGAALDWLVAAAREAGRAQAREEALQAYDDALDAAREAGLDPGNAFLASLRIERGGLLARRGDLQAARTELEAALQDVRANEERDLECRAEAELGFLLAGAADYRAALTHLESALHIAEERGDAAARVTALARLSIVHTNLARLDLGREFGERALSAARASGDERLLAVALDAQKQVVLQLGDGTRLAEIADELEAIHRWNDDLWLLQFVLFERAYVAVGTARWDEADARLREALEISRRIGDRVNELLHLSMMGWRDRCRGDLAGALDSLEDVGRRAHELGHAEWSAWTSLMLGATFLDLGEPQLAAPHLTDAVRSGEEGEARLHLVRAIAQQAWCSSLMGDHDAAADHVARSLAMLGDIVCPEGTAYMPGADAYLATGRVLLAMGQVERAATLVQPIVDAARRVGWVEAQAGGAVVLGRCAEAAGRTDDALALFRDAIEIAVDKGMPIMERDGRVAFATALTATDAAEADRQSSLAAAITVGLRAGTQGARLEEGDPARPERVDR